MSGITHTREASPAATTALRRLVCGVDGSPEGYEAVREAALLAPASGGRLVLVGAVMPGLVEGLASVVPGSATGPPPESKVSAAAALAAAEVTAGGRVRAVTRLRTGPPAAVLAAEASRMHADAIVVGSHGNGRLAGVLMGSVATRVVHAAECSVLVARADPNRPFPASIAVGVDGSESSRRALRVAADLAARMDVPLRALHLAGGHDTAPLPDDLGCDVEEIHQHVAPADALCARVTDVDLLVVGSRGLRGMRALGSVSEAVAHNASASVLIVR
jgi:nucleotide-binding universal stress UspA family protein